jgi:aminoglycoside phosphotransferase (APT) family kinase protein
VTELSARERAVLARLWPASIGAHIEAEFLPGGYSNANYRVRVHDDDFVLRVVDERQRVPGVNREHERALMIGAAQRLSAALVAYALPEGHMLTRFVPGIHLDRAQTSPTALAQLLVRIQRELGRLTRDYRLGVLLEEYAHAARARGSSVPAVAEHALEQLRGQPNDPVACHNDLNPWNVIVADEDPQRWVMLDWEFAGMGDPWFELIVLSAGLALDRTSEQNVIAEYASLSGRRRPSAAEWTSITRAFVLREFLWAHLQLAIGNRREEVAAQHRTMLARLSALG